MSAKNTFLDNLKLKLEKVKDKIPGVNKILLSMVQLVAEEEMADGTIVYSSAPEWVPGVDAFTKDADGNPVPLAEGQYPLADGTTLVIGPDMMVVEVTPAVIDAVKEELSTEELTQIVEETATALVTESEAHAATTEQLATVTAELAAVKVELAAQKQKVVELSKKVITEPIKKSVNLSNHSDDSISPAQKELAERKRLRDILDSKNN